jgi:hypothetical protein
VTVVVTVALQVSLPGHVVGSAPWLLAGPGVGAVRAVGPGVIAVISIANAWSVGLLVDWLISGPGGPNATELLRSGAAIWLTNVLVQSAVSLVTVALVIARAVNVLA